MCKFETAEVSQSPIGPYVVAAVAGFVTQAVTAVPMFVFVMHVVHIAPTVHAGHVGYDARSVAPHAK